MARPGRRAPQLPQGRPPPPHDPRRRRPRPRPPPPRPRARAPHPTPRQVLRLLHPVPSPPSTLLQVPPDALLGREQHHGTCRSLVSLKISDCNVSELVGFFQAANALQEFARGSFTVQQNDTNRYRGFNFPPRLTSLGLLFMGTDEMPTVFPVCVAIRKLDLQYTFLSTEDCCQLTQQCPNLEVRDVLGLSKK